jgi:hypothetical protein
MHARLSKVGFLRKLRVIFWSVKGVPVLLENVRVGGWEEQLTRFLSRGVQSWLGLGPGLQGVPEGVIV